MQIKCSQCGQWNSDVEVCNNCGNALSLKKIEEKRLEIHKKKDQFRTPNSFDLFLEKMAQHPNPVVKVVYYFLYSVWAVLMALVAGILYLVAGTPG